MKDGDIMTKLLQHGWQHVTGRQQRVITPTRAVLRAETVMVILLDRLFLVCVLHSCMLLYFESFVLTGCSGFYADKNSSLMCNS